MTGILQDHIRHDRQGISGMQAPCAAVAASSASDDPNLIAYGGLEPVVRCSDYPLCGSSSVAIDCWVAAHDARSAKLSAVGVPAGAV